MMKKTIYILITLVAAMAMQSCTHNDGDIGRWFGTWHVESIEMDGTAIDSYDGYSFFQFQSSVFELRLSNPLHDEQYTVGRWQDNGESIDITFPDTQRVWNYIAGFDFGPSSVNRLLVESANGSDMVLSLATSDGHTYRYILKKCG